MVIILVFFFVASVLLIARPQIRNSQGILVFLLMIYFMLIRDLATQVFEIHYPLLIIKFGVYVAIIFVPMALFIIWGARNGVKLALAVTVSFLLLLPFTRPTIPFLRMMTEWKARFMPDRFLENLSRVDPIQADLEILRSLCEPAPEETVNRLIAYLRPLPIPGSSNQCLERARAWMGPKPQVNRAEVIMRDDPAWIALFEAGSLEQRAMIFDQLRTVKNPILKEQAVVSLNQQNEELIVSAIRYLQEISGLRIGYDPSRWNEWLSRNSAQVVSNIFAGKGNSPLAQRGFSAIHVVDDLLLAKDEDKDFLITYLEKHFPKSITEADLQLLKRACEETEARPDSIRKFYQKGLMYFFLALAETTRMKAGHHKDASKVSDHWKIARESLQSAGMTGRSLAEELNRIFRDSDRDGNGDLNRQELTSILVTRSK